MKQGYLELIIFLRCIRIKITSDKKIMRNADSYLKEEQNLNTSRTLKQIVY